MCHNCGSSLTFYGFLEALDPSLLREYNLETYKDRGASSNTYIRTETKTTDTAEALLAKLQQVNSAAVKQKSRINLPSVESLPDGHFAKTYVLARMIPESQHKDLFYAEDFKAFVDSLGIQKEGLKENDQRLVIPFYDKDKRLIAFQGRALGESPLRYITITVNEDAEKFFGLNRVDWRKRVYVMEGPIDSMFIPNAIATADSDLTRIGQFRPKNCVLVFDNEPRNREIVKQIGRAIDMGFPVCLMPDSIEEKDINDQILNGKTPEEILHIIDEYTYEGLQAKLEFQHWKRV